MQTKTVEEMAEAKILNHAIDCCKAWEPDVRLIGNVRAGDLLKILERYRSQPTTVFPLPSAWLPEFKKAWYEENDTGILSKKQVDDLWKETERTCQMIYQYQRRAFEASMPSQPTGWVRASEPLKPATENLALLPIKYKGRYNMLIWIDNAEPPCWNFYRGPAAGAHYKIRPEEWKNIEYLSEPLPGELPSLNECMEYAFKVNIDIEKIVRFAQTPILKKTT